MGMVRHKREASGRAVFVDTSAWVAFFLQTEEGHGETVEAFDELATAARPLVTTDYVLAETATRLRARGGVALADRAWEAIEDGQEVELVQVDARLRARARDLFRKYGQMMLSVTDCVSFAVMKEFGIRDALTFDADFEKVGFDRLPKKRHRWK